ncbi:MAG: hypothetical protein QOI89_121 [Solirubrobacteraceae bacterium]|jgi:hypothetical protein|nr:hypothetical protein [Solirubrobacteraceae bacterium]
MDYGCAEQHGGLDVHENRPPTVIALAIAIAAAAAGPATAAQTGPEVTASAAPTRVTIGAALTVSGTVAVGGLGVGGVVLALQSDAYPFDGYATVAHLTSRPDGSFSFRGLRPDRNTRVRVIAEGSPAAASKPLGVFVDPVVAINARRLGPGETRLSVRIEHAVEVVSNPVSAFWYTARRGTSLFRLTAISPTRELSPGVTYSSAIVNPPAKRFLYRVCLNPSWEHAMATRAAHGRCPGHDFKVSQDAR